MRIQYKFTSEFDEVTERVKIHLDYFNNKVSLQENLNKVIQILQEQPLNYALFYDEAQKMRQNIVKLDYLLDESIQILSACQKIERDGIPAEPVTANASTNNEETPRTKSDTSEFQAALGELDNITGALRSIKKK